MSESSLEHPLAFEQAYQRLEQILERINSGKASLDESLKLYEEADRLISSCHKQLSNAEKKIEILIKNREGELALDAQGRPQTQEFQRTPQTMLKHT